MPTKDDLDIKGAREGPAGLELQGHALAPAAELLLVKSFPQYTS